jgi:nucleotide-binding universal stress UspA family protein
MTDATAPSSLPQPAAPAHTGGRVVVGVDGSEGSLAALTWALAEARLRHTTVHAVIGWTYHPHWGYSGMGGMFPPPTGAWASAHEMSHPSPAGVAEPGESRGHVTEADAAAAVDRVLASGISRVLEHQEGVSHLPPVRITRQAVEGHAAEALLNAVTGADLLVVGGRGHGGFTGALLGSVSYHVVSHARCPVVVVPHPQHKST